MSNPHYRTQEKPSLSQEERRSIKKWIEEGIDSEAVAFSNAFGERIVKLTTTQIRNFFGEMRRIQMRGFDNEVTSFLLLRPKLAYTVKRHDNEGLWLLNSFFEAASEGVSTKDVSKGKQQYQNLMSLMEAILAYHKFYGGKE